MNNECVAYTSTDRIATEFVLDIIYEAMERFNLTFNELDEVLTKMNYWEIFNDSEVIVAGAHEGIEPILDRIKGELKE